MRHHFVRRRESVVDIPEIAPISRYKLVYASYARLLLLDKLSRGRGEVFEGLGTSVPGGSFVFDVCRRVKGCGGGGPPFVRSLPALKTREGPGIMSDAELLYTFLETSEEPP